MKLLLRIAAWLSALGSVLLGVLTASGRFKDTFWRSNTAQWVQEPVYTVGVALTVGLLLAAILFAALSTLFRRLEEMEALPRYGGPGTRLAYAHRGPVSMRASTTRTTRPARNAEATPAPAEPDAPDRAGLLAATVQRAR
ncbi:hypothetical protein [Muricoccus radiodurans]|uniref:hypothetical protein n=1 Tax=Muricoccus radiodurans TaxID=2231721 RepID=UPI003CF2ED62